LDRCPEPQAASGQVRAFATMITELTGQDLPQQMATAREAGLPGISSFAKGLEHDLDAVTPDVSAALACPCSASASCSPPRTDAARRHSHAKRCRARGRRTAS
jgi:hypothetical protein